MATVVAVVLLPLVAVDAVVVAAFTRNIFGSVVLLLVLIDDAAFSLLFSMGGMLITDGTLLTTLLMVLFSEIFPLMCLGSV